MASRSIWLNFCCKYAGHVSSSLTSIAPCVVEPPTAKILYVVSGLSFENSEPLKPRLFAVTTQLLHGVNFSSMYSVSKLSNDEFVNSLADTQLGLFISQSG